MFGKKCGKDLYKFRLDLKIYVWKKNVLLIYINLE